MSNSKQALPRFLAAARAAGTITTDDVDLGVDVEMIYDGTTAAKNRWHTVCIHFISSGPSGNLIRTPCSVGGTKIMFAHTPENHESTKARSVAIPFTEDVAELSLLLPAWQVSALEQAAHTNGLTTAAMLRRMIEEFFGRTQRIMEKNARQWA